MNNEFVEVRVGNKILSMRHFVFEVAVELIVRAMIAFGAILAFSVSVFVAFFLGVLPQWIIFIGVMLVGEAALRLWSDYH